MCIRDRWYQRRVHGILKFVQKQSKQIFFKDMLLKHIPNKLLFCSFSTKWLQDRLEKADPELHTIIEKEKEKLRLGLNLIASENLPSKAVYDAVGCCLTNKYAEGYPGARYYGGTQFIDESELLCQKRALAAFRLNKKDWGVNVQSLSGSPANFAVYTGLLEAHDRIMGLDLPHGGHLSHGYQTENKKVSAVSKFFESFPYQLDMKTGLIDYDALEELASRYRPKLIIAGASCYPRVIDYQRIKKICEKVKAIMMTDMAHISGLVAANVINDPFEFSDIVTTTTHKSLRGPRGSMIFYRLGEKQVGKKTIKLDYKQKIDSAVFPGLQGGPHQHTIAAISTALREAASPEFKAYSKQVLANCKLLGDILVKKNYNLVSGGTDNHLLWIDLTAKGIDGGRLETVLEQAHIFVNKNTIPGDKSAVVPHGLRIGTPCITTRGAKESDMQIIADFLETGIEISKKLKSKVSGKKFQDYKNYVKEHTQDIDDIQNLKKQVIKFMSKFDIVL
eukprot:TRINITY_DN1577_c0_g1_i2.p1 TRINITY_DN1577_c0_g1~~TRINITY_DN1577_c0_g1_i2.p1  ORF type:complete len:505 (+),score=56.37 TRINITY_DN1577_c0_g1_i2:154-1668(+)